MLQPDIPQPLVRPLDVGIGVLVAADAEGGGVLRIAQLVLLRDVVAVQVVPRVAVGREDHRVVGLGEARALRLHVEADVALDRRAALAGEIVRGAEARRDVVPVGDVGDGVEVARRHEPSGRHVLLRNRRVEVIEPEAGAERQALGRPRVLNEQAEVGVHVRAAVDRRVERIDRERPAVLVELIGVGVDVVADVARVAPAVLQAALEIVRAGDIRQRRHVDVRQRRHERDAVAGRRLFERRDVLRAEHRVVVRNAAVAGARRTEVVRRVARADHDLRLVGVERRVEGLRVAGLEQQVIGDRRGPLRLQDVLGRLRLLNGRVHVDGRRQVAVAANLVGPVEHGGEAVLLVGLPRQPRRETPSGCCRRWRGCRPC